MSCAEIVFTIRIEFKGARAELNHFLKITTRCMNLIQQIQLNTTITNTIVAKRTIFADLNSRTLLRRMCK